MEGYEAAELSRQFDELVPELVHYALHAVFLETRHVGLTVPQAYLLRQLRKLGPWTAAQVGEALGITSGPVTSLTKRLIREGLLSRDGDPHDRRVAWFSCTPRGVALLDAMSPMVWQGFFQEIGTERAAEIFEMMRALTRHLKGRREQAAETEKQG